MKRVGLVQGGLGAEKEVSRNTGQAFAKALDQLGYEYVVIEADADLPQKLASAQIDVALLALHGKYAEDGTVQGLCEYLKIPYSGSGVLASAVCMDKSFCKEVLRANGVPTAAYQVIDLHHQSPNDFSLTLHPKFVVKPAREGSSVGISIVDKSEDFVAAVNVAGKYDHIVLVEDYVPGLEVTVPVLGDRALTAIEIAPKVDFYSYENKYTAGKTEYHLPARLNSDVMAKCQEIALQACRVCRVRSYARVDFRVTSAGEAYVMELNTLPGFTATSLFPKSAAHEGIEFKDLVDKLLNMASLDYAGLV